MNILTCIFCDISYTFLVLISYILYLTYNLVYPLQIKVIQLTSSFICFSKVDLSLLSFHSF